VKCGGGSAICRLSGRRIAITLVSFRKRMATSRQGNGATGGNKIIAEFSMLVRDVFDGLPITNLGGCRLGMFCGCFDPRPSFLPYGV